MRVPVTLSILVLAAVAAAQPAGPALKPTPVTFTKDNAPLGEVAAELSKAPAGVGVTADAQVVKARLSPKFDGTPFWVALESAAAATKTRLAIRDGGRSVILEPLGAANPDISSVSGPFRVAARAVTARLLLDSGAAFHEVQLDVHWEPRMPVFRLDTQPRITKAVDDRGTALTPAPGVSLQYPAAALTDLRLRLTGLTRDSKRIATLAGEFRATAAEKMLAIPFRDLAAKFPQAHTVEGVKVAVTGFAKAGGTWDADVELTYPENHPNFESFEEQKWLRDTRVRLIDPTGAAWEPDGETVNASGRAVSGTYSYKLLANANPLAKGWSLALETPGPLVELKVPFTLKDIPLP